MLHFGVSANDDGTDYVWEVKGWAEMDDAAKDSFDESCSQSVGAMFLGVYEAASPAEALSLAEEATKDWDWCPGA
jgi:hypothetical protein